MIINQLTFEKVELLAIALKAVANILLEKCIQLRKVLLPEDKEGIFYLNQDKKSIMQDRPKGVCCT
ncbi:MAG: hypothetical protein ABI045_02300 [Flavobacteriales bacterium]